MKGKEKNEIGMSAQMILPDEEVRASLAKNWVGPGVYLFSSPPPLVRAFMAHAPNKTRIDHSTLQALSVTQRP